MRRIQFRKGRSGSKRSMARQAFQNAFDTANEAADIAESGALRLRRGVTSGLDVRV